MNQKETWKAYYKKVSQRPPHQMIVLANEYSICRGRAYDVGAGHGVDSKFLLENDWNVIAFDKEDSSVDFMKNYLPKTDKLKILKSDFEKPNFLKAELIFGGASFPFCHPTKFNNLWKNMTCSLNRGGILAGTLFGNNDTWAKAYSDMTFLSNESFLNLLDGFEVLYFDEQEEDRATALGNMKHWHIYSFILRKI